MKRFSFLLSMVVVFALGARADLVSIGVSYDGGTITTVATGNGSAVFAGSVGNFVLNIISGIGSPPNPEPEFNTAFQDSYAGPGGDTLAVYVTEQGLTTPEPGFTSTLTSNSLELAVTSVLEQTYLDPTNGLYGGTVIGSMGFTTPGVSSQGTSTAGVPSYSITESDTISATGSGTGNANDNIDINAVPEPTTLTMLGSGLLGLAGFARKKFFKG